MITRQLDLLNKPCNINLTTGFRIRALIFLEAKIAPNPAIKLTVLILKEKKQAILRIKRVLRQYYVQYLDALV